MKTKLLSTVLLFCTVLGAYAQIPSEMTTRYQTVIDSLVNDFEAQANEMGLSMAVSIPGMGTWEGVSGHAEPDVDITTDMTAGIGSNSKLFTAVILLKLQESNILSLDDQIQDWIPDDLPNIDKTATIRQLLKHQTGFYDYINDNAAFWDYIFADTEYFWPYDEVVGMAGAPHFDVGTAYRYSNTNYTLAAWIIENATGNSYAYNLHQYITTPLGLNRTFDAATDTAALDAGPEASDYIIETWWPRLGSVALASTIVGPGSIMSTPHDVCAFYQALFNGTFLSAASKEQLLDVEPASYYGLGIGHGYTDEMQREIYGHDGSIIGFRSLATYDVMTGASMFFVTNNDDAGALFENYATLLRRVLKDYFPKEVNDAGISRIVSPVGSSCDDAISPIAVLKNYGSSTLSSATVNYQLDNGATATYSWSGSLASEETAEITLPAITVNEGNHNLKIWTTNPNGNPEGYIHNDTRSAEFTTSPETVTLTSFTEDFEGASPNVQIWNANQLTTGQWDVTGLTSYSGSHSLVKLNSAPIGDESYLDLPMVHLGSGSQELRFSYAYNNYPDRDEKLEVLISNDCGITWTTLYNKQGEDLSYGLVIDTDDSYYTYFPHTDDEWHTEAITLDAYSNADVLVRFRETTSGGAKIFMDDISVGATLATNDFYKNHVIVYPNPAKDRVTISGLPDQTVVNLYNISGQKLEKTISNGETSINISSLAPGMYFLNTAYGSTKIIKK